MGNFYRKTESARKSTLIIDILNSPFRTCLLFHPTRDVAYVRKLRKQILDIVNLNSKLFIDPERLETIASVPYGRYRLVFEAGLYSAQCGAEELGILGLHVLSSPLSTHKCQGLQRFQRKQAKDFPIQELANNLRDRETVEFVKEASRLFCISHQSHRLIETAGGNPIDIGADLVFGSLKIPYDRETGKWALPRKSSKSVMCRILALVLSSKKFETLLGLGFPITRQETTATAEDTSNEAAEDSSSVTVATVENPPVETVTEIIATPSAAPAAAPSPPAEPEVVPILAVAVTVPAPSPVRCRNDGLNQLLTNRLVQFEQMLDELLGSG